MQHRLLAAVLECARQNGARVLEAYPVDKAERSHDDFMFFGSRSLCQRAGFREVVRRSPTRLVMRRELASTEPGTGDPGTRDPRSGDPGSEGPSPVGTPSPPEARRSPAAQPARPRAAPPC